jgi:hypothetical protein
MTSSARSARGSNETSSRHRCREASRASSSAAPSVACLRRGHVCSCATSPRAPWTTGPRRRFSRWSSGSATSTAAQPSSSRTTRQSAGWRPGGCAVSLVLALPPVMWGARGDLGGSAHPRPWARGPSASIPACVAAGLGVALAQEKRSVSHEDDCGQVGLQTFEPEAHPSGCPCAGPSFSLGAFGKVAFASRDRLENVAWRDSGHAPSGSSSRRTRTSR